MLQGLHRLLHLHPVGQCFPPLTEQICIRQQLGLAMANSADGPRTASLGVWSRASHAENDRLAVLPDRILLTVRSHLRGSLPLRRRIPSISSAAAATILGQKLPSGRRRPITITSVIVGVGRQNGGSLSPDGLPKSLPTRSSMQAGEVGQTHRILQGSHVLA